MTVLERTKYKLIRSIMDDMDETRILEISELYYGNNPLLYSDDEINERIKQFEEAETNGNMKYYTSDQLRKHAI